MNFRTRSMRLVASVLAVGLLATACGDGEDTGAEDDTGAEAPADDEMTDGEGSAASGDGEELSGEVVSAGSSTVLPVAERILEQYRQAQPGVTASYTSIGSGGGFERLCVEQDIDFSGASRAISEAPEDMELAACEEAGIELLELQFAVDALTMVTSPETDYIECMTTEDITEVFGPDGGNGTAWADVVDGAPEGATAEIFAPDTDSGTYGFMVEDVMGLEESTQDYSPSADDNIIAQGVQSGEGTWGFFGFAYFANNSDSLNAIAYDSGDGNCVEPSVEAANDGSYGLTRPLYIYVRQDALNDNPAVADLVNFFLENAPENVEAVQYVNTPDILEESMAAVEEAMG